MKALYIVGGVAAAAAVGVGVAFLLRRPASSAPTLPTPGGRTAGAARPAAPVADPLAAIAGGLQAIGNIGSAVDKLFGGAIGNLFNGGGNSLFIDSLSGGVSG